MKTKGKRRTPEQIIRILRKAEENLAGGFTLQDICRDLNVSVSTYHRWQKKYDDMSPGDAKKLKSLEEENTRLKKMIGEMALDNAMLKELAEGNF